MWHNALHCGAHTIREKHSGEKHTGEKSYFGEKRRVSGTMWARTTSSSIVPTFCEIFNNCRIDFSIQKIHTRNVSKAESIGTKKVNLPAQESILTFLFCKYLLLFGRETLLSESFAHTIAGKIFVGFWSRKLFEVKALLIP